jgi:hypothetical protein
MRVDRVRSQSACCSCNRAATELQQSIHLPHARRQSALALHVCPHTAMYVSSYCYMCVLILLYICSHSAMYMCPHTVIYVS